MNEQQKSDYAKYQQPATAPAQPSYGAVQPYQPSYPAQPVQPLPRERRPLAPMLILLLVLSISGFLAAGTGAIPFFSKTSLQSSSVAVAGATILRIDAKAVNVDVIVGERSDVAASVQARTGFLSGDVPQIYTLQRNGNELVLTVSKEGFFNADDLTVQVPAGLPLDLQLGSGNADVRGLRADVVVNTGSGEVDIKDVQGSKLQVKTGSGNIDIENAKPGNELALEAGSGNIDYKGSLAPSSKAQAGSGNVRLELPSDSGFKLDASWGSGNFETNFSGISQQDKSASGTVGKGEATLELQTGSGNIDLDKE